MNPPTAIVLAIVLALLGIAIRSVVRKPGCGCAEESVCGGCAGCGPMDAAKSEGGSACGCGHEHNAH
jgi:hypothetical protein